MDLRTQLAGSLAALAVIVLLPHAPGLDAQDAGRAQATRYTCRPAQVIPLTGTEPAARIHIQAPLAEPLASRGVVVIPYCADNLRIAAVFGSGALSVSPRVGHIHVTVDDASWHWADASGNPLILRGLPPGPHKVLIELVDANHQVIDRGSVTFDVPGSTAGEPSKRRER